MLWERKKRRSKQEELGRWRWGQITMTSGVIKVALIKELTPEQSLGAKETEGVLKLSWPLLPIFTILPRLVVN